MEINIFGTSEKIINAEESFVKGLLNSNIPSLGINFFVRNYPNVDYWLFSDAKIAKYAKLKHKDQKMITNFHCFKHYFERQDENKFDLLFEPNNIVECSGNSGFYSVWWAKRKGFKKINLYGVMDSSIGYEKQANGKCRYYNAIKKDYRFFKEDSFIPFEKIIETNYYGEVEICRPLL